MLILSVLAQTTSLLFSLLLIAINAKQSSFFLMAKAREIINYAFSMMTSLTLTLTNENGKINSTIIFLKEVSFAFSSFKHCFKCIDHFPDITAGNYQSQVQRSLP